MSNKRNRKKTKKAAIQSKLLKLAHRLNLDFDSNDYVEYIDLIYDQIDSGDDRLLYDALSSVDSPEDAAFLQFDIEHSVANISVSVETDSGELEPMVSRLFAIPIVGVLDETSTRAFLSDDDLSLVTKCMRNHGLIAPDNSILLLPNFFSLASIDQSFASLYQLHSSLVEYSSPEGQSALKALSSDATKAFPVNERTISLRFLVGAIIGQNISFPDEEDDDETDQREDVGEIDDSEEERVEAWLSDLGGIISPYFSPDSSVLSLEPQSFYESVRSGMRWVQLTGAESAFAVALEAGRVHPENAVLEVVPFEDRPEFSLILRHKSGLMIEAFNWVLYNFNEEDLIEFAESVSMLSASLGIESVQWYDSTVNSDRTQVH